MQPVLVGAVVAGGAGSRIQAVMLDVGVVRVLRPRLIKHKSMGCMGNPGFRNCGSCNVWSGSAGASGCTGSAGGTGKPDYVIKAFFDV